MKLEKITDTKPPFTFADLKHGDVFRTESGPLYIRIEKVYSSGLPSVVAGNAVNLSLGQVTGFKETEEVTLCDVTLRYREMP